MVLIDLPGALGYTAEQFMDEPQNIFSSLDFLFLFGVVNTGP